MSATQLKVAPTNESELYVVGKGPESRAERIRRLQENARALAREEVEAMLQVMHQLSDIAEQISSGGDAYAVGIRELSGRLHSELNLQSKAIEALLNRH